MNSASLVMKQSSWYQTKTKMAPRMYAAARYSLFDCSIFVLCVLCVLVCAVEAHIRYERAELLITRGQRWVYTAERPDSIPPEILRLGEPGDATFIQPRRRRRRHRERRQKRGKRGSLHARLKANPHRPALPSLFLANCRSLVNKIDEISTSTSSAAQAP